jgi:hypothetical protein
MRKNNHALYCQIRLFINLLRHHIFETTEKILWLAYKIRQDALYRQIRLFINLLRHHILTN